MTELQRPSLQDVLGEYGEVESVPLTRIQAATAKAMVRSWTTVPHVTHHDRIDLTALEEMRKIANRGRESGDHLTPIPYLLKAVAGVLTKAPRLLAAFDEGGGRLVLRKYINVGLAINAPSGLVVGVIRGADRKSVAELASEAKLLADRARSKGLTLAQMSGGSFTVSSLGNLGGDGFTPIINTPEAAILGVGRIDETPRRAGEGLTWHRLLPVSLSYDHRVLNGTDAGRFMHELQAAIDLIVATEDASAG